MLFAGFVAAIAVVSVATTGLGLAYAARAQAQTASDAAALAAAVATYPPASTGSPVAVARRVAVSNGAELISCECGVDRAIRPRTVIVGTRVTVDVPVFGPLEVHARSRAEFDPRRWLGR